MSLESDKTRPIESAVNCVKQKNIIYRQVSKSLETNLQYKFRIELSSSEMCILKRGWPGQVLKLIYLRV